MLLAMSNVSMSYGVESVLNSISFVLNRGDRAGLVGANGVGKSTLLKIAVGEVEQEGGEVNIAAGAELGYLPQTIPAFGGETISDLIYRAQGELRQLESRLRSLEAEMSLAPGDELEGLLAEYAEATERFEARGGYKLDHNIGMVLDGLRLGHIGQDRPLATLSGGEKARAGLAALLMRSPNILLLDEPTNHLDFLALDWLREWLAGHRGALLIASHDRHFLNGTANTILEITEHEREIKRYVGDYDAYLAAKEKERVRWVVDWERQQEEIRELRDAVREKARQVAHNRPPRELGHGSKMAYDFKGGRVQIAVSRNIASAEEKLRRIEANPIPRPPDELQINTTLDPLAMGGRLPLVASGLCKGYGSHSVLDDVSLTVHANSRIAIVGPNGAGKSTLLKILAGREALDRGEVAVTRAASIGYLDQEGESLDPNSTVEEAYRAELRGYVDEGPAGLLRYGLFTYDELGKKVGTLSVGQRRKLQIARLIAQRANLLLLDEPTNHVSFSVLEAFERALLAFPGPIVAVSHDRLFIERFAQEVWELRDGKLQLYPGGLGSYQGN